MLLSLWDLLRLWQSMIISYTHDDMTIVFWNDLMWQLHSNRNIIWCIFFLKSFGCALLYAIKLAQGMCFVHEKDFKTLLKIYKGWGSKTTSNDDGQQFPSAKIFSNSSNYFSDCIKLILFTPLQSLKKQNNLSRFLS